MSDYQHTDCQEVIADWRAAWEGARDRIARAEALIKCSAGQEEWAPLIAAADLRAALRPTETREVAP